MSDGDVLGTLPAVIALSHAYREIAADLAMRRDGGDAGALAPLAVVAMVLADLGEVETALRARVPTVSAVLLAGKIYVVQTIDGAPVTTIPVELADVTAVAMQLLALAGQAIANFAEE